MVDDICEGLSGTRCDFGYEAAVLDGNISGIENLAVTNHDIVR